MLRVRGNRAVAFVEAPEAALNGARIPSMAEEVSTDLSTLRLRVAGSRK